ncbi:hypothetical protein K438DRAFT_1837126 [Mycena galopus ATCC 62051]|nr:hypothetical protein K438DRAFT_1837126 [Mycena galopus ATCC 62051]
MESPRSTLCSLPDSHSRPTWFILGVIWALPLPLCYSPHDPVTPVPLPHICESAPVQILTAAKNMTDVEALQDK